MRRAHSSFRSVSDAHAGGSSNAVIAPRSRRRAGSRARGPVPPITLRVYAANSAMRLRTLSKPSSAWKSIAAGTASHGQKSRVPSNSRKRMRGVLPYASRASGPAERSHSPIGYLSAW